MDTASRGLSQQRLADVPASSDRCCGQAGARFFACHPDGVVDGCTVRDGIVFNHYDSSFESWAMTAGAVFAACTETPGLQPIEARIQAHAAMIEAFVRHASDAGNVANREVAAHQACTID